MIEELMHLTSIYSNNGMRVKEILIKPWESPNAKFLFEFWKDGWSDDPHEMWEINCLDLRDTQGIPLAVMGGTQLKTYDVHPLLWGREVYFTITGIAKNIPSLMGDLFIEHAKVCGNWVDFQWLYSGLPKTLETLEENQLAIPINLKDSCFQILERHGVKFNVNSIESEDHNYLKDCQVLFFSHENWPDSENFRQSYIIGKGFSARRLS